MVAPLATNLSLVSNTVNAMIQRAFLRVSSLSLLLLAGCGSDPMASPFPEDDASTQDGDNDSGSTDDASMPSFDIPSADTVTQFDVPPNTDRGGVTDRGTTDTGGTDRGTPTDSSVCPSSCSSNAECGGCRGPSDPPGSTYCCMSGLCLYMSTMCVDTPDVPSTSDGGGDGGLDDGGVDGGLDVPEGGLDDIPEGGLDIPEVGLDLGGGG